MRIELENLLLKACHGGINIFTGTGFSHNSYNKADQSLPLAIDLAQELSQYFTVPNTLPLPNMASIIESKDKANFYGFLKRRMEVAKFDMEYSYIEKLNIKSWFTTNIDNLTEKIFENSTKYYLNNNLIHGPSLGELSAIEFYPLHGSILNDNRPMIFTSL